ncbi:MAG: AIM24 family protein [Lachnospiraceae bacterium]|nr:AIM24 family protein [Lachnospiraceae bacterium]
MIKTNLFQPTEAHKIVDRKGRYSLLEYEKDISVTPGRAADAYYASKMNVHKRQVIAVLNNDGGVILQAGAMQMMLGQLRVATNIKGAGDLMKKMIGSKVTGETAVKPRYEGAGILVLEPTYRYVLFEDLARWNGTMVIEDGMFLACDDSVNMQVTARTNLSSALLGGEGLFNTCLTGAGFAVLESPVPAEELIVVDLERDEVRLDGSMAIAWSGSLEFTVERTTKTLIGSAASGEGLVNVYRGTGRILIAPVSGNFGIPTPAPTT